MKKYFHFWILTAVVLTVISCSTKNSTVVSRNYHALTAKYNILFNGSESLKKGVEELKNKNESDFYRELSLEGIEFDDKIYLPGQSKSQHIATAEEKAAKAIQKHSMEIRGTEHNVRMDEAMLLLGMSRYYDQRYLAALDAFNYALDNYYDTNLRNELQLWRAKTLLKLGNTRLARQRLARITNNPETKPDTRAWAYAFIAESFRENGLNDTVAQFLSKAARTAKNKHLKNTLAFKSAQVWEKLFKLDSAKAMTELILKKNYPENFIIHTKLYRMHLDKDDTLTHEKNLKKLKVWLDNYYFNKYFPDMHFRKAEILEVRHDTLGALQNYTAAARSSNKSLKRLAYEKMADIHWNRKNYLKTGKYLDSMLTVMDKNTLDYLLVSQRRRSIDQIVKWEEIIQRNDSILKFIRLDSARQVKKIENYIARLRRKKEEQVKAAIRTEPSGTFYFYNPEQVKQGKELFKKNWGDRRLEDLWRLTNKYGSDEEIADEEKKEEKPKENGIAPEDDTLNVAYYLKRLPKTEKEIDSIEKLIVKAHLYLGINYANEKFKEYELAEKNLKTVLQSRPDPEQQAQAYYMLYKIYTKTGREKPAGQMKNILEKDFPDSPFTRFIQNPESEQANSSKAFLEAFQDAYQSYEKGKWSEALSKTESAYDKFKNHPDAPKLLLLSAKTKGKLQGIDAYIDELERLIQLHPEGTYTDHAKDLIKKLKVLKIKYDKPKDEPPYYLVHVFKDTSGIQIMKQCLQTVFEEEKASSKYFFTDRFDDQTVFLLSGTYLNPQSAEYIREKLIEKACKLPETFVISRNKYINLQFTKQITPNSKKQ